MTIKYSLLQLTMLGVLALPLANCSSGLPDMPSMPALATLAADTPQNTASANEKARLEVKTVDAAQMNIPGELGDQFLGKANAPVTIVEYASLSCPNCMRFHAETLPKLKKAYIDKGKVRLVYREFPIGRSSAAAAMAVRCVPAKDYFKAVDKFYTAHKDWVAQEVKKDDIYKVVESFKIKRDKFDACIADQKMNDALVTVKNRGRSYGVAGTPTFFVNGRKVAGAVSFEEMQPVIEEVLNAPRTASTTAPTQQATVKAN